MHRGPRGRFPLRIEPIGPSIGAHSAPGTLGLVFLGDAK